MIKKITLLTSVCLFVIFTVSAQMPKAAQPVAPAPSAKDFFWPASGKNKASFYLPGKSGEHTFTARTIYYLVTTRQGDTAKPKKVAQATNNKPLVIATGDVVKPTVSETYIITDISRYGDQIMSTEKYTVQFTASEVQVVSSTVTNALETNSVFKYDHPITMLKLPHVGQRVAWTYTDRTNNSFKCMSEWMTIPIDGAVKKAIKVTVSTADEANEAKTVLYYVEGVGLWKTESVSTTGAKEVKDQFDGLDYESITDN